MQERNEKQCFIPQTRDEVLDIIANHKVEMAEFGVQQMSLFGSAARDLLTPESDVDVVVDFSKTTYRGFLGFKEFLESILHRDVDLLTLASVKGRLKEEIAGDLIHVSTS